MGRERVTRTEIEQKVQDIALARLGRRITESDVRLFSILNKAETSYSVADNRYFDEGLEDILGELEARGHISYNRASNSIRIRRSFYDFMIEVLRSSPEEYKVR